MLVHVVKSKIHRVTVTEANLNYIGSITIDEDIMDAANVIANEKVSIVNNNNGERFETYVIPGCDYHGFCNDGNGRSKNI
jgi:aspartate 1-decarboxylase